jgi:hypothetical protein
MATFRGVDYLELDWLMTDDETPVKDITGLAPFD